MKIKAFICAFVVNTVENITKIWSMMSYNQRKMSYNLLQKSPIIL